MNRAHVLSAVLLLTGLVHLLPVLGVLGAARLEQLYGLRMDEPNLLLLMRHRALLFGLLGLLLVAAAFRPAWQGLALLAAWG
ncbi:MAG: phosphopantetheine adenylyltransferase, partial [Inhella sp.]